MTNLHGDSLAHFLGSDVRCGAVSNAVINNHIIISRSDVAFQEDNQPEEHGKLFVFTGEKQTFSIQLCYLFYNAADSEEASVYVIQYLPPFFDQFPSVAFSANIHFSTENNAVLQFTVSEQTLLSLQRLSKVGNTFKQILESSHLAISLLDTALDTITIPVTTEEVPACRFLAFESEREKIQEACAIIVRNEGKPHTIRELSRKVAMNECYLKKGFKALTGKTIHEYQQQLRIEKATDMLQNQGFSVTDVALTLGYSSISHFSTAFKRITGLKPCELIA